MYNTFKGLLSTVRSRKNPVFSETQILQCFQLREVEVWTFGREFYFWWDCWCCWDLACSDLKYLFPLTKFETLKYILFVNLLVISSVFFFSTLLDLGNSRVCCLKTLIDFQCSFFIFVSYGDSKNEYVFGQSGDDVFKIKDLLRYCAGRLLGKFKAIESVVSTDE